MDYMKVLVTGGAGFIGSHVCELLANNGFDILVIDDLSTGNLANLTKVKDKISFVKSSLEDYDFNSLNNIYGVIHLAAQASVPLSISNFYESSKTNLLTSLKIIEFCSVNKIPLVYASSSAIYGGLQLGNDELESKDLLSPYAVDKYAIEKYAKVAYLTSNLRSLGLRFFNVYGPRQDPSSPYSGVISVFINNLLLNQDITINGGDQTRDFVYVTDVAGAIVKSLEVLTNNNICDHVNVLTGSSISINDLADSLFDLLNSNVQRLYQDLPLGDPLQSSGTTLKLNKLLGVDLNTFIKLDAGLTKTITHLDSDETI